MKTTLRNTMILICLMALVGAMQAKAVDYTATPPAYEFQSTSVYSAQWSNESVTPMLNNDGSMTTDTYMSGPRRAPGTPGGDLDPHEQQPLGDGLWALMLMAFAYIFGRVFLKKTRVKRLNR